MLDVEPTKLADSWTWVMKESTELRKKSDEGLNKASSICVTRWSTQQSSV